MFQHKIKEQTIRLTLKGTKHSMQSVSWLQKMELLPAIKQI